MNIDLMAALLEQTFGGKKLADLRAEAEKEFNGTCFWAFRAPAGPRQIIVVCLTGAHEIAKARKTIAATLIPTPPWTEVTVDAAFEVAVQRGGLGFFTEANSTTGALLLISLVPVSTRQVEDLLGLTP